MTKHVLRDVCLKFKSFNHPTDQHWLRLPNVILITVINFPTFPDTVDYFTMQSNTFTQASLPYLFILFLKLTWAADLDEIHHSRPSTIMVKKHGAI